MSDAAQERIAALLEKKKELEEKRKKLAELKQSGGVAALLNAPAHLSGDSQ